MARTAIHIPSNSELKQWKPTAKQIKAARLLGDPQKTRIFFDGAVRSGKTLAVVRYFALSALQYQHAPLLVIRKHANACVASAYQSALRYCREYVPHTWWHEQKKERTILFRTGSFIHFDGLDNEERAEKLLSTEWFRIFANEITQTTANQLWLLFGRLSAQPVHVDNPDIIGARKLIADCNPKDPHHWVHDVFIKGLNPTGSTQKPIKNFQKNWARLSWSVFDNIENLPADLIAGLDALPDVAKKRMRDGIWCAGDNLTYDEFTEKLHVIPPFVPPADWKIVYGIDFGFTNPWVCLKCAIDPSDRLYILDELYVRKRTTGQMIEPLRKMVGDSAYSFMVADWDAADIQTLIDAGFSVTPADKRVEYGVDLVKYRLIPRNNGKPGLHVCSNCTNVISEFLSYERDTKVNDHAMDALRYIVTELDGGSAALNVGLMLAGR